MANRATITFLKEKFHTYTQRTDEIQLYYINNAVSLAQLMLYCKEKKKETFYGAMLHTYVFFTSKKWADFPTHNEGDYSFREPVELLKHLKAIYIYNQENGKSILTFYQQNNYDSQAERYEI